MCEPLTAQVRAEGADYAGDGRLVGPLGSVTESVSGVRIGPAVGVLYRRHVCHGRKPTLDEVYEA